MNRRLFARQFWEQLLKKWSGFSAFWIDGLSAFCRVEKYVQIIQLEWIQNMTQIRVSFGISPVWGIKFWPVGGRYELSKTLGESNGLEYQTGQAPSDGECMTLISKAINDVIEVVVPFFEKTATDAFEAVTRLDGSIFPIYSKYLSSLPHSKEDQTAKKEKDLYNCSPVEIGEAMHLYFFAITEHRYDCLVPILKSLLLFSSKKIEIYKKATEIEGDANGAYRTIIQTTIQTVDHLQIQLEKAIQKDDAYFDCLVKDRENHANEILPFPLRTV